MVFIDLDIINQAGDALRSRVMSVFGKATMRVPVKKRTSDSTFVLLH